MCTRSGIPVLEYVKREKIRQLFKDKYWGILIFQGANWLGSNIWFFKLVANLYPVFTDFILALNTPPCLSQYRTSPLPRVLYLSTVQHCSRKCGEHTGSPIIKLLFPSIGFFLASLLRSGHSHITNRDADK